MLRNIERASTGSSEGPALLVDFDGVVADISAGVCERIAEAFGFEAPLASWTTYDFSHLPLPKPRRKKLMNEIFSDREIYAQASPIPGALEALCLLDCWGWKIHAVTARSLHLREVTRRWARSHDLPLTSIIHTKALLKMHAARELKVVAAIEDNPAEAELLAGVCESWLLDQPYNASHRSSRVKRAKTWSCLVNNVSQMRLF